MAVVFTAVTSTTLYQREVNLLPTQAEGPEGITTSSGLLLIEYRCHQVFLQLVYVFLGILLSHTDPWNVILLLYY
jgi:hypothetical protein